MCLSSVTELCNLWISSTQRAREWQRRSEILSFCPQKDLKIFWLYDRWKQTKHFSYPSLFWKSLQIQLKYVCKKEHKLHKFIIFYTALSVSSYLQSRCICLFHLSISMNMCLICIKNSTWNCADSDPHDFKAIISLTDTSHLSKLYSTKMILLVVPFVSSRKVIAQTLVFSAIMALHLMIFWTFPSEKISSC